MTSLLPQKCKKRNKHDNSFVRFLGYCYVVMFHAET